MSSKAELLEEADAEEADAVAFKIKADKARADGNKVRAAQWDTMRKAALQRVKDARDTAEAIGEDL